jgi:hypothetical protein
MLRNDVVVPISAHLTERLSELPFRQRLEDSTALFECRRQVSQEPLHDLVPVHIRPIVGGERGAGANLPWARGHWAHRESAPQGEPAA